MAETQNGRVVPRVEVDWAELSSRDEFFQSVFRQTGAPDWHGENLDALNDTWVGGGICTEGPPFIFVLKNESRSAGCSPHFMTQVREIAQDSVKAHGGKLDVVP